MDIMDAFEKRFSCRKYLKRKVDEKDIVLILDAGAKAPNAGNLQNWDFIITRDEKKKEKLTKASLNQRWMNQADVFIVICSDSEPSQKFYPKRGKIYDNQNCCASAENMLLMASSIGLGACWVGAFEKQAVSRALKLPEHIEPQAIITLGYPDEEQEEKKRAPLNTKTHFDEYGNKTSNKNLLKELKASAKSSIKSLYNKIPRGRKN